MPNRANTLCDRFQKLGAKYRKICKFFAVYVCGVDNLCRRLRQLCKSDGLNALKHIIFLFCFIAYIYKYYVYMYVQDSYLNIVMIDICVRIFVEPKEREYNDKFLWIIFAMVNKFCFIRDD